MKWARYFIQEWMVHLILSQEAQKRKRTAGLLALWEGVCLPICLSSTRGGLSLPENVQFCPGKELFRTVKKSWRRKELGRGRGRIGTVKQQHATSERAGTKYNLGWRKIFTSTSSTYQKKKKKNEEKEKVSLLVCVSMLFTLGMGIQ